MENKTLIKKTGLYLIGNLSSKIVSFLLIPLYAFNISAIELGDFDFSQTIMLILVPIIFIAIWESILKFLLSKKEEENIIISTSLIFILSIISTISIIAIIIKNLFNISIQNYTYITIMIISYSLANIWQYYARGLGENQIFVISSIFGTLINFVCTLIFLRLFNLGISSLYLSYIFSQFSIFIILERKLKCLKKIKKDNFDKYILKEMLIFSSPLVLNLVSMWFISGFGRVIVNKVLGAEMGGIYAFSNKFGVLINVLGSVVSMALIEESVLKSNKKDENLDKYFTITIEKLFIIFQSIIIVVSPFIVIFCRFIKETDYSESLYLFPYFLLYAVIMTMATNVGSIFQAIEKTKYIFITTVFGAISSFLISIVLVNKLYIVGVAIGQIVGAITMLILRIKFAQKFINLNIKYNSIMYMLIIYIINTTICINSSLITIISILIINIGIVAYANKKDINEISNFILTKCNTIKWRQQ